MNRLGTLLSSSKFPVNAILVVATFTASSTVVQTVGVGQMFYEVSSPFIGLVSSGLSWSVSSKGECAHLCLWHSEDCVSFYYDASNGLCVSGEFTQKEGAHYTSNKTSGAILYHRNNYCAEENSFYLAYLNNTFTCVYFHWTPPLSYPDALDECHRQEAELLIIRTAKGLEDFDRLQKDGPIYCWIGLDNRDLGIDFRWQDTQTILTESETSAVFAASQPDNSGGEKNSCCYFNPEWSKLDDCPCFENKNVVCTKDVNGF